MSKLPSIMTALRSNLVFILAVPLFWLCFVLLYKPAAIVQLLGMGADMLHFNTTIIMCVLLAVMIISRVLLMAIHRTLKLDWWKFFLWEASELLLMSLFMALYLTLMYRGAYTYFSMVGQCLFSLLMICLYPYVIFNVAFAYRSKLEENTLYDDSLMRFVDNTQKLKLMIASSAVLYVEADENYVHVRYMEGEKQLQLGYYDAALALASEAHRIYPEGHAAQYSLAKIFLMLGQVDTATHILHRITEQDTTHFWYNIS